MTDKLKPCPFCGGEAYIDEHSFYNEKTKAFTDHLKELVGEDNAKV